jgi:hypothetical protein
MIGERVTSKFYKSGNTVSVRELVAGIMTSSVGETPGVEIKTSVAGFRTTLPQRDSASKSGLQAHVFLDFY